MQSSTNKTAGTATALNVIGWVLVGTAFLFTGWSAAQGGNAFFAGQRVGQLFATWLIMLLVAWLFTRNSSPATRAYGRIAVGILLWLVVASNVGAAAREKKVGQAFLRDAIAMNAAHTQKFQALNERFARADLADVLTPASVTTPAGIAKGREQVAQFRELIAARDALLKQNLDDVGKLVANLPEGPTKTGAEATVGKRREETMRVFNDLSTRQLAHLDLIAQILDWCAAQGGKISNNGGHLRYASREQAAELQVLLDKLAIAAAAADKSFKAASHMEQSAEERKAKSLKQATELLK